MAGIGYEKETYGLRERALIMTAGIPGTGIGGLFYILLCIFMPLVHAFRALRGNHKPHHLKTGIFSILLSAGILLSLYGEAKLLIWLANKAHFTNIKAFDITHLSPALIALPFIILFTLLIVIQILRFIFHGFKTNISLLLTCPAKK